MSKEFVSPFSARYASPEMSYLFSAHNRIILFRKLWIALAKGEKKLGLPITQSQISSMQHCIENIDFAKIAEYEKKFRHDVMAHIHAFGDLCPEAKPIIHLGATSTYVTDNADLIQLREGLKLLFQKLVCVIDLMANLVKKYKSSPCLGFTHFQNAQPTTIGKRICLWLQDFALDAKEWERLIGSIPFLGAKGATGTQSSFLLLFNNNHAKVKKLEEFLSKEFNFSHLLPISGQTYTRKLDLIILNALGSFASSAHKMATDIRLLAHEGEMAEFFEKTQVGSSAMPHKRNPIYSERICGISRFVMSLPQNPAQTLATQWLERSLDDSANKRICVPEAFLGTDAILNLLIHLLSKLTVFPQVCMARLKQQIPWLLMENILMKSSQKGGHRQELHEALRKISQELTNKKDPLKFLSEKVQTNPDFHLNAKEIQKLFSTTSLVGRAPEQAEEFLQKEIKPLLLKYRKRKNLSSSISITH